MAITPNIKTMDTQTALVSIFAGVFALLATASVAGVLLKSRLSPATANNLNTRIQAWWVMIGTLALVFWIGSLGIILLFALVTLQCLREFIALSPALAGDRRAQAWCFLFFLPLQYFLIAINELGLFHLLIPTFAFLLLPITAIRNADTDLFLERIATIQWGLMICVYCISHVPALLALDIPGYAGRNTLLVAFLVLTVQSSDVFQYVWGRLLGKRRISPKISPSKTLEGLVGGVLTSTAVGTALWWVTPFTPWQAALIALTLNLAGFLGGLVLSAVKRGLGVKDWGKMISGHGGMLDRVDSLVFSAPVFFHIIRHWWAP